MNQTQNLINVFWKEVEDTLRCYKSQISDFPGPRSTEAVGTSTKFRGTQAGFGYGEDLHIVCMVS
ncbi:uncharacterized protein METZ01_LOCUS189447 [marine metagenome]|uniref:Uncharacterized protein n=1 Tax=marine metagenome TaxID=408172 RepID=A0A382DG60_9ZZZZ